MDEIEERLRKVEDTQTKCNIKSSQRDQLALENKEEHKAIGKKLEELATLLQTQKGFLKGILWVLGIIVSGIALFHEHLLSR